MPGQRFAPDDNWVDDGALSLGLAPQHAFKNPVMAVVWLGTLLTAGLTLAGMSTPGVGGAVTALLFVTVLFANFAEAVAEARGRGLKRLSLETGSGAAFEPAIALYRRYGFDDCAPFADYKPDPFSRFMTRAL